MSANVERQKNYTGIIFVIKRVHGIKFISN